MTSTVVKGRIYPLRPDVTLAKIEKWHSELEENDLLRTWSENGRVFAYFPTWSKHQRIRSRHQRKTPEPPSSVVTRCQLTSSDRLNPNPNPNPNHYNNPSTTPKRVIDDVDENFKRFWNIYPRRVGKPQALKAFKKQNPKIEDLEKALAWQVKSEQWQKDGNQFVPHPATYLNQRRWEDEQKTNLIVVKTKPEEACSGCYKNTGMNFDKSKNAMVVASCKHGQIKTIPKENTY